MLTLITGVITVSVTTAIFPKIASLGQAGEFEQMKGEISSAVVTTMSLVIPATIGMMVLSRPIIELVFERNAFTSDDTAIVASLLTAYSPYIIFQSLSDVVDRGFYAVGDSKTPVIIVVTQQVLNIILNFILIKFFDLEGLAYATVLSTAIGSAFMLYKFRDNFGAFNFRQAAISLGKIILATCIMASLAMLTYSGLAGKISHIIALFGAIIVAGFVYVLLILLARIPEVMELVNQIYHKIFGRREKEKE